ncbi:uncharacterized protein LOC114544354 [Dendronephthya gigantea]|uniref:uncharacterized protein LOC114544352 n=1 Tax=Dendronephthya gigantea TaxID=151771 RepID=UPI001068FF86|nr:uncharacterized protein LOC114544352 [Dendronephthya gigantea]XP_028418808.1 uncharacterized protein LOC114544354 [Dendronephthya gigantea]
MGKTGIYESLISKQSFGKPIYFLKPSQPSIVPGVTRVVDGENFVEVCKSKGAIYYYIDNGLIGEGGFGGVFKGDAIKRTKKTPVASRCVDFSGKPSGFSFTKRSILQFLHLRQRD